MAKVKTVADMIPTEIIGDEALDERAGGNTTATLEATSVDTTPAKVQKPAPPAKLAAARIVPEKERTCHHVGARRFRIRARDGTRPAVYVLAPAGDQAEDAARAEYLRHVGAEDAKAIGGLAVVALPD